MIEYDPNLYWKSGDIIHCNVCLKSVLKVLKDCHFGDRISSEQFIILSTGSNPDPYTEIKCTECNSLTLGKVIEEGRWR